jgi:nicotinamide-nucleotide amidase
LKAIVDGPLQFLLGEIFGRGSYREREVMVECNDESQLAPALRQVAASNPDVYIKSRASRFGPDVRFRVTLSASATSAEKAEAMIEQAWAGLASALRNTGVLTPE